jgi:hypothetical protein
MQTGLDGPDRVAGELGNLLERQVAVEAEQDHVTLRFRQARDGLEDERPLLQVECRGLRIVVGLERRGSRVQFRGDGPVGLEEGAAGSTSISSSTSPC